MAELARAAGLSRAGLYKALREDGNPGIVTVTRIACALGLRLDWQKTAATHHDGASVPGTD